MCRELLLLLLWSLKLAPWAGTFPSGIPLPEELVHLREGGSLELGLTFLPTPPRPVLGQSLEHLKLPRKPKESLPLSLDNCWVKPRMEAERGPQACCRRQGLAEPLHTPGQQGSCPAGLLPSPCPTLRLLPASQLGSSETQTPGGRSRGSQSAFPEIASPFGLSPFSTSHLLSKRLHTLTSMAWAVCASGCP